MKTQVKLLTMAALAVFIVGCTATGVQPYSGEQEMDTMTQERRAQSQSPVFEWNRDSREFNYQR